MSCVSSNWGAVISERSVLLCHLPGSHPNPHHGAREGSPHDESEHRCQEPAARSSEEASSLLDSEKIGERRQGEQTWGMLESSTVCFHQGHPESMKWTQDVQNKSLISLFVTMKTPFFFFLFSPSHMHILVGFFLPCFILNGSGDSGTSTRRFLFLYVQLLSAQPFVVASRVNITCLMGHTRLQ